MKFMLIDFTPMEAYVRAKVYFSYSAKTVTKTATYAEKFEL